MFMATGQVLETQYDRQLFYRGSGAQTVDRLKSNSTSPTVPDRIVLVDENSFWLSREKRTCKTSIFFQMLLLSFFLFNFNNFSFAGVQIEHNALIVFTRNASAEKFHCWTHGLMHQQQWTGYSNEFHSKAEMTWDIYV